MMAIVAERTGKATLELGAFSGEFVAKAGKDALLAARADRRRAQLRLQVRVDPRYLLRARLLHPAWPDPGRADAYLDPASADLLDALGNHVRHLDRA